MSKRTEADQAHEDPETTQAEGEDEPEGSADEEFDKDRALGTIRKLREIEKEQKAEIARLKAIEDEKLQAEAEEAERQKSLEDKLRERDEQITALERRIQEGAIKADFLTKATERGYADPALAFIAAKEAGLLGEFDPEAGSVSEHDFDALEEKFPLLAGEADEARRQGTGDAGVRGGRGPRDESSQFNDLIRNAIRGR